MRTKHMSLALVGAVCLSISGYATAGDCASSKGNLVSIAAGSEDFSTLVTAVKAAGLVETLESTGPFTIFAPTNDAFAKLPKGTVEKLLANPDQLGAILKYHVVPGKVMAADVVKLNSAGTALGQTIAIDTSHGVMVNNANVIKTDLVASNGVIHVIDTVLLPMNDIIEAARTAGSFKTLLAAIDAAGLTDALRSEGPFTVFAPTDAAFAKLPKGTVEALLKDIPTLKSILTYHVVPGKVLASDVVKLSKAKTLQGSNVRISTSSGVKVDNANVVKTDVMTTNGVIHVIDTVIMPK